VEGGQVSTVPGPATDPMLRIATDEQTFFDLGSGILEPVEALVSGAVAVSGPPPAVPRCLYLLGLGGEPSGERAPVGAGAGRGR
jgi:hypothetical protein